MTQQQKEDGVGIAKSGERKRHKRGQNEGSIYKRKDGRWVGAVLLGYQGGKPKRKCYYGETRKEVSDKVTEAVSNVQRGIPVVTERQTLKEFYFSTPLPRLNYTAFRIVMTNKKVCCLTNSCVVRYKNARETPDDGGCG